MGHQSTSRYDGMRFTRAAASAPRLLGSPVGCSEEASRVIVRVLPIITPRQERPIFAEKERINTARAQKTVRAKVKAQPLTRLAAARRQQRRVETNRTWPPPALDPSAYHLGQQIRRQRANTTSRRHASPMLRQPSPGINQESPIMGRQRGREWHPSPRQRTWRGPEPPSRAWWLAIARAAPRGREEI